MINHPFQYFHKTIFSVLFFVLIVFKTYSQNTGIGAAAFVPNASSMLEVQSGAGGNRGFLPPRVTDAQRTAMNPLPAAAQGLIVYQTNTVGASLEGLYYNISTTAVPNWIRVAAGGDWYLTGNVGTIPGVAAGQNFIGTTDVQDFVIATNTVERVRILSTGFAQLSSLAGAVNVGTGNSIVIADAVGQLGKYTTTLPPAGTTLELWYRPGGAQYIQPVSNNFVRVYDGVLGLPYGIYYDGGTQVVGGYFRTTDAAAPTTVAVEGFSDVTGNQTYGYLGYNGAFTFGVAPQSPQTISGMAVYGVVDDPTRASVFARTTANASVAAQIDYSNVWIGSYNYIDDISAAYAARPSTYAQLNNAVSHGFTNYPANRAIEIYNGGGNPGYGIGADGEAWTAAMDGEGVYGYYNGTGGTRRAGGYFFSTDGVFTNNTAVAEELTNSKVTGVGVVAEIIPTPTHGRVRMTCSESPEYWYNDYGTVQLLNGHSHVNLDPILADIIIVDAQNPIKVFPQANILNCNGLAVLNKSATGFDLVEVSGGTSSGEVDYQIVAKPKTNYGEGRFAYVAGPLLKYEQDPPSAKAANQVDWSNIYRWPADWDVYGYDVEAHTGIGDVILGGSHGGKIKLGDGKYGDGLPSDKNGLKVSSH